MKAGRTLEPEDVIAHYRVVGPLGAGGMGEVYLAQDQTLERNVALKVLPPEFVKDDERLRRFVLEAKSASSLSHPNIVTIYEIGTDVVRGKDGVPEPDSAPVQFISMELIHGKTLTTLIHEERTDLRTMLGYLAQAAEGLAKAHAAGIVHRDLKPGNIMVSGDGYAKVLDFGLAKLTEGREPEADMSSAPTMLEEATGAGSLLGTTGYMSPEQIRAKGVDHRSDVFSFGCVLYEATTRTRPFVAETAVETMHKILNDTPVAIEERNPKAPAELRRLIRRCLAKNPDQRVQSMKDLAIELREVVDEWDNLTSTATSIGNAAAAALASKKSSVPRWIAAGAGVVAVAAVAVALWSMRREAPPAATAQPFQTMRMSTQTNRGDVTEAALSRDGRYLAYLTGEVGKGSVRVRQVATGSDLEVVPSEEGLFEGLSFTPDGNYLFYLKRRRDAPNYRGLMQVPSLGGPSRERAFDVDTRVTFSPDGKSIAFNRGEPQNARSRVIVRELDSGKERTLATVADPRTLSSAPSWSADGKKIVVAENDTSAGTFISRLVVLDAADGRREELETLKGGITESVAWLPDGGGVIRSGYELGTSVSRQIAIVDYPSGRPHRVTNDVSDYFVVSVSAADEAIAAVKRNRLGDLWIADAGGGDPRPLTSYRNPENSPFGVTTCPDGSVVFAASRDQSIQLWSIGAAGGAPEAISSTGALAINPRCVPGGIVYDQFDDAGGVHVWCMDPGGSNPRVLTPDWPSQGADVSKDGRLATVVRLDDKSLWAVPVGGGASRNLSPRAGLGKLSPDGSKVLNTDLATDATGLIRRTLQVYPTAGGAPVPGPKLPPQAEAIEWGPDDASLYFVDRGLPAWNLFRVPVAGGEPHAVTSFADGRITAYEVSPDRTKIALAVTTGRVGNVWVVGADGSKPVQVTKFPQDEIFQLHWMADGKRVVVNAGKTTTDAVMIRSFR